MLDNLQKMEITMRKITPDEYMRTRRSMADYHQAFDRAIAEAAQDGEIELFVNDMGEIEAHLTDAGKIAAASKMQAHETVQ